MNLDLVEHDSPFANIHGTKPYNGYLWPTESWWASRDLQRCIDSRWNFGIVALLDGRFATEGLIWCLRDNNDCGKPVLFTDRVSCIRASAARMIRDARQSKCWNGPNYGLSGSRLAMVINWARNVVARESGKTEPKPVTIPDPKPAAIEDGLPLFDFKKAG
jgi:hypothetical protein